MKLFIDARWVRIDYHDGISRYTAGLVRGFLENHEAVTVLIHDKRQLDMLPDGVDYLLVNNPISWRELFIARKLNQLGAEVVFSPLQVMGFWGRKYKLILTLQDIIYYRHPKPPTGLAWYVRLVWRLFHMAHWPQRWLLNRADHVVTVSETSKGFIEQFRLTDRAITVVYNAPSIESQIDTAQSETKNLIYMGSFMPYKNVETLIKGVAELPSNYRLHLLSKVSSERRSELIKSCGDPSKVIFHNGVSDDEYVKLLQSSHCLVTATKEEGFGLPITEAQTLGVPVVCSDLPVLREVAGGGALYFDADDATAFANRVLEIDDEACRKNIIANAIDQSAEFTWSSSAKVLNELANNLLDK